jgi:hypothetical protein
LQALKLDCIVRRIGDAVDDGALDVEISVAETREAFAACVLVGLLDRPDHLMPCAILGRVRGARKTGVIAKRGWRHLVFIEMPIDVRHVIVGRRIGDETDCQVLAADLDVEPDLHALPASGFVVDALDRDLAALDDENVGFAQRQQRQQPPERPQRRPVT